jgi:hypothetical protein
MMICRMSIPTTWLERRIPEGFTGELHWAIHDE